MVMYLNRSERFEHPDHTLCAEPVPELCGIQVSAVSCQGRAGDVSASGSPSALLLVAVSEAGNVHVMAQVLKKRCITAVANESLFFGLMISCPLSVI